MFHHSAGRHVLAAAFLGLALGACSSGSKPAAAPNLAEPMAAAPEGGVPGEVLDVKKVGQSTLRYTVRLDGGKAITVDEPASRYLATGAKVGVVAEGGRTALVKR